MSLNVVSVLAAFVGLTSAATRVPAGTSARRRSNCFSCQLTCENIEPCQVAARPGEAGDKTKSDRVLAGEKDDWDCRGCRLGREMRGDTSARDDHPDAPANQFGRQFWQPIDLTFGPAVFDRHVLAVDIASILETLAE